MSNPNPNLSTRIKPGQVLNPRGRPSGALNVTTIFKNNVLSRLAQVLDEEFGTDEFVADFRAQVVELKRSDPIKALRMTQFLMPTMSVSADVTPALFAHMSQDRLQQVAQAVVTSAQPSALPEEQTSDCNGLREQNAQDAEFSVVDNGANKSQV